MKIKLDLKKKKEKKEKKIITSEVSCFTILLTILLFMYQKLFIQQYLQTVTLILALFKVKKTPHFYSSTTNNWTGLIIQILHD